MPISTCAANCGYSVKQIGTPICVPARECCAFCGIVAMGLSQEPHNMLVMMFDCSSVLSGYPGHLGNFFIIVVEFWKVRAQAVGYITFRHFSV